MRYDKGYTGGLYETPWQTPNTREAASFGRPLVETRPYVSLGGPGTGRLFKLRGALASELQEEGPQRTEVDAKYGTTLSFVGQTEEILGARLSERASGGRLLDGSLDLEAYRTGNSETLSGALLHRESLEFDERLGLELSDTDQKSQGKTRSEDPLLEISRLAAYKKRPLGLEPAWPSWMRADSRLFPISREPGRLKEKHPSSLSPDAGPRYRLSPPSRSLQEENDLDSTRAFIPIRTSGPDKSDTSSGIFAAASKALSFSSGTEAPSTRPSSSSDSLKAILESTPFTSRDMRLNSTRTSLSGQISSEDWPTASQETPSILENSLTGHLADSGSLRDSYGLAFTHRTYRGHDLYPLFNESSVSPKDFILPNNVRFVVLGGGDKLREQAADRLKFFLSAGGRLADNKLSRRMLLGIGLAGAAAVIAHALFKAPSPVYDQGFQSQKSRVASLAGFQPL